MNMLKLDNDHQILAKHCILKCTLHAAITALGYAQWSSFGLLPEEPPFTIAENRKVFFFSSAHSSCLVAQERKGRQMSCGRQSMS